MSLFFFSQPPLGWGDTFLCHSVGTKAHVNYTNVLDLYLKDKKGFCFYSDLVRPTDEERIAIEKRLSCSQSPREQGMHAMPRATQTSSRVSQEAQGVRRKVGKAFTWVSREGLGQAEQAAEQARDWVT